VGISESRLLQLALERLESQKRDIDAEIADLRGRQDYGRVKHRGRPRKQSSAERTPSKTANKSEPKKKMSAAHRLAISQAMKQRWANRNKESGAVQ
jgi:hypothetical protein